MIESRIARRYLWAARNSAHTAFLSLISMSGLAVGVAVLLISLALLSGLQGQIKQRLIASSPQLLIEPVESNTIENADAVRTDVIRLGMRDVQPVIAGIAWGANDQEKRGRPIRIRSFAPGHEPASRQNGREHDHEVADRTVYTTREFAASLGLDLGQHLTVVAPRTRLTPFGPVPVWRKFRIAHLITGPDQNTDALMSQADAGDLFATDGKPTAIEVYGDAATAEKIQGTLQHRFPGVQVKTWREVNRPLFLALRLEKIVMFVTISLIIFVAALNLVSSLSMLIMEKRLQVGILRTLGATEKTILSLFLQLGLLIGLTGTLVGNIFGLGLSWAANHYHLVPLPADIYFVSHLPFKIDTEDVVGVNVVAVLLSVAATWYPARIASRLDPITAIREEE